MIAYQHLLGFEFDLGERDCYSLVRDFYQDNFQISLPNIARPDDFWRRNMNLYGERYHKYGFRPLDCHPSDYQDGDVVLMAIRSKVGNHTGVLVENGKLLHHLPFRLSLVEPYQGLWRDATLGVFRHKDVKLEAPTTTADLMDFLPAHVRARIPTA